MFNINLNSYLMTVAIRCIRWIHRYVSS